VGEFRRLGAEKNWRQEFPISKLMGTRANPGACPSFMRLALSMVDSAALAALAVLAALAEVEGSCCIVLSGPGPLPL
jgi:hypothetical protein